MIEIYSITGAKIINKIPEANNIKVNLHRGIYIIKIYNNNNISTCKIIVK